MNFFDYMRDWFIWITNLLVRYAMWLLSMPYPLDQLWGIPNDLSSFTASVAGYLYDASHWYNDVTNKLANIISLDNIYTYFRDHFDAAINAWNWVCKSFTNVWDIVDTWWRNRSFIVQGWISSARQLLQTQIDSLTSQLTSLQGTWDDFKGRIPSLDIVLSWFDNWWGNTLTHIIDWGALTSTQIDTLIFSRINLYQPFWSGWQEWRDKITEFFTDPEEWLYKAVDRIIERFW